ncbi:MAG: response regulator [Desulfovibrionaceae bacterium]
MDGKGRSVLVVDDEMHLRIFIATVFETNGFSVRSARDGAQGLKLAQQSRPDLITLDLMMPGEGGVRMYRALKADPRLRDVPVMVVSAVADATFRHSLRTVSAGLDQALPPPQAYVEKPPTAPALLAAAGRVLGSIAPPAGTDRETP